jgi:tRNA A22 N-methylase
MRLVSNKNRKFTKTSHGSLHFSMIMGNNKHKYLKSSQQRRLNQWERIQEMGGGKGMEEVHIYIYLFF